MYMRIRKAREEFGYTREKFAELLDVSGGFSGGFMHMGEDTLGSVSTTQGYAAVNIIYEVNGEKFYLIYMSPEARNIMTFGKLDDMMREYLGE